MPVCRIIAGPNGAGKTTFASRICRRCPRSLRNLLDGYASAVDQTYCFLNDRPEPVLVFSQKPNAERRTRR